MSHTQEPEGGSALLREAETAAHWPSSTTLVPGLKNPKEHSCKVTSFVLPVSYEYVYLLFV